MKPYKPLEEQRRLQQLLLPDRAHEGMELQEIWDTPGGNYLKFIRGAWYRSSNRSDWRPV